MLVNMHEAKSNLSKLVKRAADGEEIIIGRAGQPIAMLVAYRPSNPERKPGMWKGQVWISDDFDDPDPELEALFYDGPIEPER